VSGITDTYKSSVEECITSLKDTLRNGKDEDVLIVSVILIDNTYNFMQWFTTIKMMYKGISTEARKQSMEMFCKLTVLHLSGSLI